MTREEAIELIHDIQTDAVYSILPEEKEALDMAIECLSAQNKAMTEEELAEFKKELANAVPEREKGEWIPVNEETKLPEHDVICCNNEGDIALGYLYFDEEEKQIACDRDPYVMFGIVAYMELPEPYKEESKDMRGGKE